MYIYFHIYSALNERILTNLKHFWLAKKSTEMPVIGYIAQRSKYMLK